jgi:hypothetical protein
MKLILTIVCFLLSVAYMWIGVNVQLIWPDQPESHFQAQELIYAFGSGVFFSIAVFEFLLLIKETK